MQYTKDTLISACLYTLVYFAVWSFAFVHFSISYDAAQRSTVLQILRITLRPFQGVLNVGVFFYHKVKNIMSHNPGISAKLAFTKVWNSREDPEHIVSNLTMLVKRDNQLIELRRNNVRNRNAHANEIEDQNDSDECCSIDDADVHIVQEDGGESQLLEES